MHRPLKRLEQSTLLWNNLKRKVTVSSTRLTFRGVKLNLEHKKIIINTNWRINSSFLKRKIFQKFVLHRFKIIVIKKHNENKVLYLQKVAPFRSTIFRLEIKREDIIDKSVSVTKIEVYTILKEVCIVSNRLT
jgi:hypothetical protein